MYIWARLANVFAVFRRERQHASQLRPNSPGDQWGNRCLRKSTASRGVCPAFSSWLFGFLETQTHGDIPVPVQRQILCNQTNFFIFKPQSLRQILKSPPPGPQHGWKWQPAWAHSPDALGHWDGTKLGVSQSNAEKSLQHDKHYGI